MNFEQALSELNKQNAVFKNVKVELYNNQNQLIKTRILNPNTKLEFNTLCKLRDANSTLKDGYVTFADSLSCYTKDNREIFKGDIVSIDNKDYCAVYSNLEQGTLTLIDPITNEHKTIEGILFIK